MIFVVVADFRIYATRVPLHRNNSVSLYVLEQAFSLFLLNEHDLYSVLRFKLVTNIMIKLDYFTIETHNEMEIKSENEMK